MAHSIQFRILSRLAIIISVVLLILSLSTLFVIRHILWVSMESRSKDDMQLLTYLIEDMQADAAQTSRLLSINESVQLLLSREQDSSASREIISVRSLMANIEKIALLQNYVHSFCIVTADHEGYWNSSPNSGDYLGWFEETVLSGQSAETFRGFTSCYTFPVTVSSSSSSQLVSYVAPVNTLLNGNHVTIGCLIINLNFDQLVHRLKNQTTLFDQIAIFDQNQALMYLSSGDPNAFIQSAAKAENEAGRADGKYYCRQSVPSIGWQLVAASDMSQAYLFIRPSYVLVCLAVLFAVVCCIFIPLYPLLNTISHQIQELSLAIDQVRRNNLDTSVSLTGSSELKNISDGFQLMTVSIKKYIQKSIEENQRSQQLSVELLLAKINPHFIYNTLNSIIYLARKERCEDVIQLTGAFICLLQDSIHLGHSPLFARFENEAEVIRQYVVIQQYRYRDRFLFDMHLDKELSGLYIPRNILQPLVENSLIHGICTDDKQGTISLRMTKEEDFCLITLTDDGVGMEQSYADRLLHARADTDAVRRARIRPIGIHNIADRLAYLFGKNHVFSIESEPGRGTKITLRLPLVREPEHPPV